MHTCVYMSTQTHIHHILHTVPVVEKCVVWHGQDLVYLLYRYVYIYLSIYISISKSISICKYIYIYTYIYIYHVYTYPHRNISIL